MKGILLLRYEHANILKKAETTEIGAIGSSDKRWRNDSRMGRARVVLFTLCEEVVAGILKKMT